MEELICIESGPDVQGWFVKGNKYSSGGGGGYIPTAVDTF